MRNKVSQRLTEALRERKLSQKEFAQKSNINYKTIGHYCTGRRTPSIDSLMKICKELGESMDYMTGLVD